MKKFIPLSILLAVAVWLIGCNNLIGEIIPDVINDSVNTDRTSWTVQGTGSGARTQYFTLSEDELKKVSAKIQYVGGSSKLVVTQGELSRTTKLHGSGISQSTILINMTGFVAGELTMNLEVSKITSGQTTISWE